MTVRHIAAQSGPVRPRQLVVAAAGRSVRQLHSGPATAAVALGASWRHLCTRACTTAVPCCRQGQQRQQPCSTGAHESLSTTHAHGPGGGACMHRQHLLDNCSSRGALLLRCPFALDGPCIHALRTQRRAVRTSAAAANNGTAGGRRITQNEFTEKAWQAVVAAPELAQDAGQQIVETEHLFKALLEQPNGLARSVVCQDWGLSVKGRRSAGASAWSSVHAGTTGPASTLHLHGFSLSQFVDKAVAAMYAHRRLDRLGRQCRPARCAPACAASNRATRVLWLSESLLLMHVCGLSCAGAS